jgi:serine/threonine-protein kinase
MKTCPVCDSDFPDQHNTCPTDGAVLIVSHELAAGSLVRGKYRITRKLGQGGMGVVYQAEHMMLGGQVALKFLTGDLGKDPKFIKRFRMEARAAYQLRHPNIVEVTDLDQAEDSSFFIAMEYVEGPSLRAALDEAPAGLEIARALELGRGIATGLAEAHAHATVHRDIKPENILLATSRDGREQPKILDFGIAAITESVTRTSVTRGLMLTPNYAAPEQWEEMPAAEMDGRTDLYALGCVLYEMLTGRTPFHAHNTSGWMKQHLEETPRPPSELRPELADWPGVDGLAMRLLAKNRDDRPQDAELLGLLDDLLYGSGQARPEPASEQRRERPETIIEEEWRRLGAVPTPLPQRVSQPPSQHLTQPPSQLPLPPPSPQAVPGPKPATRKFPGWAWGALAILALAAVVAAVRLFAPHPAAPADAGGSGSARFIAGAGAEPGAESRSARVAALRSRGAEERIHVGVQCGGGKAGEPPGREVRANDGVRAIRPKAGAESRARELPALRAKAEWRGIGAAGCFTLQGEPLLRGGHPLRPGLFGGQPGGLRQSRRDVR